MLHLTNESFEKFYLTAVLVETVRPRQYRGGSVIVLTTGREIVCLESPDEVVGLISQLS